MAACIILLGIWRLAAHHMTQQTKIGGLFGGLVWVHIMEKFGSTLRLCYCLMFDVLLAASFRRTID
jgi:hypothetical protein